MKKIWMLLALAGVLSLTGCGSTNKTSESTQPTATAAQDTATIKGGLKLDFEKMYPDAKIREFAKAVIGTKAPNFTLSNMDGKKVSLNSYAGKKVLLEIGSAYCPSCQQTQPGLDQFREEHPEYVVLQAYANDNKANMEEFLTKTSSTKHDGLLTGEEGNTVFRDYKVTLIPSIFFINENGIISYVSVGTMSAELLSSMAELVKLDTSK